MTYLGETLRKAREAKGLSTSQVAQKTHILVQIITEIEQDNFKRIPAAIYGRGFIRQICECLEIDPAPLVAEFMDVYTGRKTDKSADPFMPKKAVHTPAPEKAAAVAEVPAKPVERAADIPPSPATVEPPPEPAAAVPPPAEPVTPVEPPPAARENVEEVPPKSTASIFDPPPASQTGSIFDPPPAYDEPVSNSIFQESKPTESIFQEVEERAHDDVKGLDLFEQVKEATPPNEKQVEAPPPQRPQDIFASAYDLPESTEPSGSSAAEKLRENLQNLSHDIVGRVRRIPRSTWRLALLALAALAVISLIVWGCRVLYRVTTAPADPAALPPTTQEIQPAAAPAEKPAAKATAKPAANKPAAAPAAAPLPKLRSTGQKVPPLYMD